MENVNIKNEKDLIDFLSIKIKDIKKTSDQFDSTDVISEQWDLVAELKVRKTHYNDILIEKIKYDALMNSPKKNKRYIVSTPNGVFSFNIEKVKFNESDWVLHLLPASTEFNNKEKIYKYVNYINFNQAKKLK